jgi:hypothetical protein
MSDMTDVNVTVGTFPFEDAGNYIVLSCSLTQPLQGKTADVLGLRLVCDAETQLAKDVYVDENSYPVAAAEWMKANLDVENMKLYNEYNYGSYLLFQGIPVFIDSRCDLYSPEFNGDLDEGIDGRDIFSDALNIPGLAVNYENMFEQYGVTHIILYENCKLGMILRDDPDYKVLYAEGNFEIFERLNVNK